MYYFKHLPKESQSETADLLVAHGHENEEEAEKAGNSKKKSQSVS